MPASRLRLTLLLGRTVPRPAPPVVLDALESVEVKLAEDELGGFQVVLASGRGPRLGREDALLDEPLLAAGSRAVLVVGLGARSEVLFDGFVTHRQLAPGDAPGRAKLTLTGRDVTVAMDRVARSEQHPAQGAVEIVTRILSSYPELGLEPEVVPPASRSVPSATEKVPSQQGTDREYVQLLAERNERVFVVTPGRRPGQNVAYWGPAARSLPPLPSLTVNAGPDSNVRSLRFQHDPGAATRLRGQVQDARTAEVREVRADAFERPALAAQGPFEDERLVRTQVVRQRGAQDAAEVEAEARARAQASSDVVQAEGALDAAVYGALLRPGHGVAVRGAGRSFDGGYRVRAVTHRIARAAYTQTFTLAREGLGSLLRRVPV